MLLVNLFGGPGTGKSTTAAGLFHIMKLANIKVELITEYPKELTYDEDWVTLADQMAVFKEQSRRQTRLLKHVDYAITDSPLLMQLIYGKYMNEQEKNVIVKGFKSFERINILLKRTKPYHQYGRTQTEKESNAINAYLPELLAKYDEFHYTVDGDATAPRRVLEILEEHNRE